MSRKKIVAGNWKMNTTFTEAMSLASGIMNKAQTGPSEVLLFPPFPYLKSISDVVGRKAGIFVGAQNCHTHKSGAYTGEVSAAMLASVGCSYVLIGHSERRLYFNETKNELVNKIHQALEAQLKIVFCFGEQLLDRKNNQHFSTVEMQLKEVLTQFPHEKIHQLVLAYEPVWAIGTGETASPQQAQEMHAHIRKLVATIYSDAVAQNMSILYGGSCNAQNARELFACADVDGGLIGGASLKLDDFITIINALT